MNLFGFIFSANTLVGIGAVIFALSYTYSNIRSGSNRSNFELIQIYKDQVDAQKEVIADLQNQVNTMRQEIGKLQGLLEANEKKIKDYMDLLGPSGELKTTLNQLVSTMSVVNKADEFMNNFPKIIKEAVTSISLETKVAK